MSHELKKMRNMNHPSYNAITGIKVEGIFNGLNYGN